MDNKPSDPKQNIVSPQAESLENGSAEAAKSQPASTPAASQTQPPGGPRLKHFLNLNNKYLAIFLALLIMISVATYLALTSAKKSNDLNTSNKVQSLTSQQLAAISGSTTLVGDPQQTLDVQSNSIFEGKVLLRSNLDVAGGIKVGGSLSLPSITVSGASGFGPTQVNGTLSVSGDTSLQGQVTLGKNLTVAGSANFGSLSASQLNVTSLQLTGDLAISRHVVLGGGTPSKTNGGALGGGGTASVNGSDTGGTITINTGSSPPAGCFVTINFTQKFGSTPHVIISPSNSDSGSINYYSVRSTTSFSVCTSSPPAGATTYLFDYIIFD